MYQYHSLVNSHFKQIKITCTAEKFRVLLYIVFAGLHVHVVPLEIEKVVQKEIQLFIEDLHFLFQF